MMVLNEEFCSVKNDTSLSNIRVTFAHTVYISSHFATHPRQNSCRIKREIFHTSGDPIQSYLMISKPLWHPSQ